MADSVPLLVYPDGGGFGPRAETFGSDGADVIAEERADGEAGDELILVEGGTGDSAPTGLRAAFEEGVLQTEIGMGVYGLRTAGAAAQGPADTGEDFITAVDALTGGGGGAQAFAAILGFILQGGAGVADVGPGGGKLSSPAATVH